jgi:hypothetical protein
MGKWRYTSTVLTSALDGGEWPALRFSHFTLGRSLSRYLFCRSLIGPQSHSERYEEGKTLLPLPGNKPQPSKSYPYRYNTDWAVACAFPNISLRRCRLVFVTGNGNFGKCNHGYVVLQYNNRNKHGPSISLDLEISRFLWKPKIRCCFDIFPSLNSIVR